MSFSQWDDVYEAILNLDDKTRELIEHYIVLVRNGANKYWLADSTHDKIDKWNAKHDMYYLEHVTRGYFEYKTNKEMEDAQKTNPVGL